MNEKKESLESESKPKIQVVAAIFLRDGKILAMQRGDSPYSYVAWKYEFPGGKVEPGETGPEALMRELLEEMELSIEVTEEHRFEEADQEYPDYAVHLTTYLLEVEELSFTVKEHINLRWMMVEELMTVSWHAGNRPVLEALLKKYQREAPYA